MATYCKKCEAKTSQLSEEGYCSWCFDDLEEEELMLE